MAEITHRMIAPGPLRADQFGEKSPYELANGHPILCLPTRPRGASAAVVAGHVIDSDPAVRNTGFDAGYSRAPGELRAPDLSVNLPEQDIGWIRDAPPLAIEYADRGIRFNAVAPGVIKTPMNPPETHAFLSSMHPLGRMGETSEVVDAVLYLESAPFVTGETLHVDGGAAAGRW